MTEIKHMELTMSQKLQSLSHKYYGHVPWVPKTGDYYTSSRADLELYQIVEANEKVVRTRYCHPDHSQTISEWPTETFLEGFGVNRVWVPDIFLTTK